MTRKNKRLSGELHYVRASSTKVDAVTMRVQFSHANFVTFVEEFLLDADRECRPTGVRVVVELPGKG